VEVLESAPDEILKYLSNANTPFMAILRVSILGENRAFRITKMVWSLKAVDILITGIKANNTRFPPE
jgi:hypothetical protein